MSVEYVWLLLIGFLLNIPFGVNSRHLVLLKRSYVNLIISFCSISLHPLWCYIFIFYFGLGLKGAGFAFIISQALNSVLSTVYLHYSNQPKGSLQYFTKESFHSWGCYLSLEIPAAMLFFCDAVGYEIQAIFAIFLSSADYSTHLLSMSLETLLFTLVSGIHIGMSIKIGVKIVSSSIEECKFHIQVLLFFSLGFSMLVIFFNLFFGSYYMYFMTPNEEVYTKTLGVLNFICLYIISATGEFFFSGVLKGLGYLTVPTLLIFANSYLVQTILTYLFAYIFKLAVVGIWLSMAIGTTCVFASFGYLFFSCDLQAMKQEILERLAKDKNSIQNNSAVVEISDISNNLLEDSFKH